MSDKKNWHQELKDPERLETMATLICSSFPDFTEEQALKRANAEATLMMMRLNGANLGTKSSPKYIGDLTVSSIIKGFAEIVCNGLSFSEAADHVYFQTNVNALQCVISSYGEAQMRINRGLFIGYDEPIVYYECDSVQVSVNENGTQSVSYQSGDRTDEMKPKGVFMKIIRADSSFFFAHFSAKEMNDFKDANRYTNKAWETGETGMFKAKCIKHSFKRQPIY